MSNTRFSRAFLGVTFLLLVLGFFAHVFWIASSVVAIIPSAIWVYLDLRRKSIGSDLLATLSLTGTLLTQEYLAGSVIGLMLASGRVLENWAEGQAERQLKSLLVRIPRTVKRVENSGEIVEIAVEEICVGDRLLARAGEIVAADGELLIAATLDESALTGEPLPIRRVKGEGVLSGVVNVDQPFEYLVNKLPAESTYAGIIELVKAAQARTSPGVRLAGRWAIFFVPFSLLFALGTWLITGESTHAVAVLVAATPCPLILAVPIAVVAGLSNAAKQGAVIKGGAILEALARVETVLLDKTGTITHGGPAVDEIVSQEGVTHDEVLRLAASVDQYSGNVIARALVAEAHAKELSLYAVHAIDEVVGHHISGVIENQRIEVGQLVEKRPPWLVLDHPLIVAVTRDDELIGAIGLNDPLRAESRDVISELRLLGVKNISLVTGDKEETAKIVARQVGITDVHSQVSAQRKLEITQLAVQQAKGAVVVVGDGINDAPALAIADIGVAMGARGATAASEAADVVIVEDSLNRLTTAIKIAKVSRRKAVEAASLGMGLSIIVMFFGATGFFSPTEGAFAQEAIDVIAICWALTALKSGKLLQE